VSVKDVYFVHAGVRPVFPLDQGRVKRSPGDFANEFLLLPITQRNILGKMVVHGPSAQVVKS